MSYNIAIVQYFELLTISNNPDTAKNLIGFNQLDTITIGDEPNTVYHRYQNFFVNETKKFPVGDPSTKSEDYAFAPFRAEGTVNNLGGDNSLFSVLFPTNELVLRLVEQGNSNRLSRLKLTTVWLNANFEPISGKAHEEYYVGIGAAFSETTVELRFRSAMDSVGSKFPARTFTRGLVGLLPLNSNVSLQ